MASEVSEPSALHQVDQMKSYTCLLPWERVKMKLWEMEFDMTLLGHVVMGVMDSNLEDVLNSLATTIR